MRRAALGVLLMIVLAAGLGTAPAGAATHVPGAGRPLAQVAILPIAHRTDGGASITAFLLLRCQPGARHHIQWEGYLSAQQGDVFAWAGVPMRCDGRPHVVAVDLPVSAPPDTQWFTRGRATLLVSIVDEDTLTEYASDTRTVRVR